MSIYTIARWDISDPNAPYFSTQIIIDEYFSSVWNIKRDNSGTFQLIVPMDEAMLAAIDVDDFVFREDTNRAMIITAIQEDRNDSNRIVISGAQAETLLKRRIVLDVNHLLPYNYSEGEGATHNNFLEIGNLLNYNIGDLSGTGRKMAGIHFNLQDTTLCDPLAKYDGTDDDKQQFNGTTLFDALNLIFTKNPAEVVVSGVDINAYAYRVGAIWYLEAVPLTPIYDGQGHIIGQEFLGYSKFNFKIEVPKAHENYAFAKDLGTINTYTKLTSTENYANIGVAASDTKETTVTDADGNKRIANESKHVVVMVSRPNETFSDFKRKEVFLDKIKYDGVQSEQQLTLKLQNGARRTLQYDYQGLPSYSIDLDWKAYEEYGFDYKIGDIYPIKVNAFDSNIIAWRACDSIVYNEDENGASVYPTFAEFAPESRIVYTGWQLLDNYIADGSAEFEFTYEGTVYRKLSIEKVDVESGDDYYALYFWLSPAQISTKQLITYAVPSTNLWTFTPYVTIALTSQPSQVAITFLDQIGILT